MSWFENDIQKFNVLLNGSLQKNKNRNGHLSLRTDYKIPLGILVLENFYHKLTSMKNSQLTYVSRKLWPQSSMGNSIVTMTQAWCHHCSAVGPRHTWGRPGWRFGPRLGLLTDSILGTKTANGSALILRLALFLSLSLSNKYSFSKLTLER